jgi:hypothetical protein
MDVTQEIPAHVMGTSTVYIVLPSAQWMTGVNHLGSQNGALVFWHVHTALAGRDTKLWYNCFMQWLMWID